MPLANCNRITIRDGASRTLAPLVTRANIVGVLCRPRALARPLLLARATMPSEIGKTRSFPISVGRYVIDRTSFSRVPPSSSSRVPLPSPVKEESVSSLPFLTPETIKISSSENSLSTNHFQKDWDLASDGLPSLPESWKCSPIVRPTELNLGTGPHLGTFFFSPGHWHNQEQDPALAQVQDSCAYAPWHLQSLPQSTQAARSPIQQQSTVVLSLSPISLGGTSSSQGKTWVHEPSNKTSQAQLFTRMTSYSCRDVEKLFRDYRVPNGKSFPGTRLAFDSFKTYTVDANRAHPLMSDLKNQRVGLLAKTDVRLRKSKYFDRLDATVDSFRASHTKPRKVRMVWLAGYNGCGKTSPVIDILKSSLALRSETKVSVPTRKLMAQWKAELDVDTSERIRISTHEVCAFKSTAKVLIIDEFTRHEHGWVDLAIIADPAIELVILLGDPTQLGATHDPKADVLWTKTQSDSLHFRKMADYYQFWTYRTMKSVASKLGVPCYSNRDGLVDLDATRRKGTIVCMSDVQANLIAKGGHPDASTCASVQGATVKNLSIIVDHPLAAYCSDHMANMLLNRATHYLGFVGPRPANFSELSKSSPLLRAFLSGGRLSVLSYFQSDLKGMRVIRQPLPG